MTAPDYERRYRELYDEQAATYDAARFGGRRGAFDRELKNELVLDVLERHELLGEGATVLDAAAGTGRLTHALLGRGAATVVAVDISPEMLRRNEEGVPAEAKPRARFVVGNLTALELADASVDAATLASFLHLVPRDHYAAYASELARVLRPGGLLVAEVANALPLLSPPSFARVVAHRHVRRRAVTSHVYPWEIAQLFPGLDAVERIGASYPVVTRSYGRYRSYSRRLGRNRVLRNLGGKTILVLRKR